MFLYLLFCHSNGHILSEVVLKSKFCLLDLLFNPLLSAKAFVVIASLSDFGTIGLGAGIVVAVKAERQIPFATAFANFAFRIAVATTATLLTNEPRLIV